MNDSQCLFGISHFYISKVVNTTQFDVLWKYIIYMFTALEITSGNNTHRCLVA